MTAKCFSNNICCLFVSRSEMERISWTGFIWLRMRTWCGLLWMR
jgi:hypothetical protein